MGATTFGFESGKALNFFLRILKFIFKALKTKLTHPRLLKTTRICLTIYWQLRYIDFLYPDPDFANPEGVAPMEQGRLVGREQEGKRGSRQGEWRYTKIYE